MDSQDLVYDEKAAAIVHTMERSITRLGLGIAVQPQFVSLLNAIEVQVEDRASDPIALRLMCDALLALADAHGLDRRKLKLDKHVSSLLEWTARHHPGTR